MLTLGTYHRKGSHPYHGHCIHNDRPARTRTFTMKGLFAAVIWIALWAVIITTVVSHDLRGRYQVSHGRIAR
jgi:hypothetical protein